MNRILYAVIMSFISNLFVAHGVNTEKNNEPDIAGLINNSSQSVFDFKNQTIHIDKTIEIKRSGITIKNLQIHINTNQKLYDLIIQTGQDNNRYYNITINGNEMCSNGLSIYNSKRTHIENCHVENVGYNAKSIVSSAIRLIGDCSDSKINNCTINNVQSHNNSTGITISQTLSSDNDEVRKYSKRIEVAGCVISDIISDTNMDADGIKVLEETADNKYNKGDHIFRNITFENCHKRGLKLQTSDAKCHNIICKNGNFSQGVIDFFGENPFVDTLKILNLNMNKHTYGIFLHGFKKAVIKNVTVESVALKNSNKTLVYSENDDDEGELHMSNVHCVGYNMLYRCRPETSIRSIDISDTYMKVQYHYSLIVNSKKLVLNNFKENKQEFDGWYHTFTADNDVLQVVKSNNPVDIDKNLFDKIARNKETDMPGHTLNNN